MNASVVVTKTNRFVTNVKALVMNASVVVTKTNRFVTNVKALVMNASVVVTKESEIQGMIHGGKPVGLKPTGYYPNILIESASAGVS